MRIQSPREKYIEGVFGLNEDRELTRAKAELSRHKLAYMSISPAEARILQFFIRGFGVKRIVEIGTYLGYSSLCMAQALPEEGQLITLEKNPEHYELARKLFSQHKSGSKIEALCGDALEILPALEAKGPFDLIFIDADKAGYSRYAEWAERNVRQGGLIVGDNTFLFGALWGESGDREAGPKQIESMKEFNNRLADRSRFNSIMIPTEQGMTVAQKL